MFSAIVFVLVVFVGLSLVNTKSHFLKLLYDIHMQYLERIKEWISLNDGRIYLVLFAQIVGAVLLTVVAYFVIRNILLIGYFIFKAPLWINDYKRKRCLHILSMDYRRR